VRSEETIAIETARHLRHMVKEAGEDGPEAYLLRINPRVTAWFIADGARELHELERETGRYFHFEGSEGLPLDHFAVTMEGSRAEIEERSVPFRAGEEVHVDLVEPHMYNEDDAVAKVDGYVISVAGAGPLIGEKRMVRIDGVTRSAASASLVGGPPPPADDEGDSGDGSTRGRSRRGRRGGRGRRRPQADGQAAPAEAEAAD
jgi:ribonuclease G